MGNFQVSESLIHRVRATGKMELARSLETCSSVSPTSCLAVTGSPHLLIARATDFRH